jgi:hypothetical protein
MISTTERTMAKKSEPKAPAAKNNAKKIKAELESKNKNNNNKVTKANITKKVPKKNVT